MFVVPQRKIQESPQMRFPALATLALAVAALTLAAAPAFADDPQGWGGKAIAHDTSPPLSSLDAKGGNGAGAPARHRQGNVFADIAPDKADRHHQSQIVGSAPPTIGNWEGVNNVNGVIPPDTNGDVGDTQYVQWVNLTFRVFDKYTGAVLKTAAGNTLWSDFGGGTAASVCASTNQGDPVVLYDKQDQRWIMSQFAFSTDPFGNPTPPYYQCIAVSQTSDALGQYNRYG